MAYDRLEMKFGTLQKLRSFAGNFLIFYACVLILMGYLNVIMTV
jgi:hypothetical protein